MFGDLGFEVVPIAGFTQSDWPSIMEANVPETARKGHLAWLMCFLPKLLSLTQRANKSGQWLIAEDSAWPATFATPTNINKYVAEHGNCWLGYRSSMRNGKLPRCSLPHKLDNNGRIQPLAEKQHVRAPYGLKLLALDDQAIRLLYRAFANYQFDFAQSTILNYCYCCLNMMVVFISRLQTLHSLGRRSILVLSTASHKLLVYQRRSNSIV